LLHAQTRSSPAMISSQPANLLSEIDNHWCAGGDRLVDGEVDIRSEVCGL
jgi:hypothetical protein